MNQEIFDWINSFAGKSLVWDGLGIFFASYLQYILVLFLIVPVFMSSGKKERSFILDFKRSFLLNFKDKAISISERGVALFFDTDPYKIMNSTLEERWAFLMASCILVKILDITLIIKKRYLYLSS